MSEARAIAIALIDEAVAARAHFQIWWTLRSVAIPRFLPAMNDLNYVDFFHASNAGHYKLFLLALSKIFDRDTRVAGMMELRKALRSEGLSPVAAQISKCLKPVEPHVKAVLAIRNHSLVHNQRGMPRSRVYKINGITPNQLRAVIDRAADALNYSAQHLNISNVVFDGDRLERATLAMLESLERGAPNKLLERTRGEWTGRSAQP